MALKWRIQANTILDHIETGRVEQTIKILGITDAAILDSYSMGVDKPYISSIFILEKDRLTEVHLTRNYLEFDCAYTRLINNYRVIKERRLAPGDEAAAETTYGEETWAVPSDEADVAAVVEPQALGRLPSTSADKEGGISTPPTIAPTQKSFLMTQVLLTFETDVLCKLTNLGEDYDQWLGFLMTHYPPPSK